MPTIKAHHGEGGSFSNVSPSKQNWVSGFFGVGGFSIVCVANFNEARVELDLMKGDKDKNKATFDKLHANKAEIESKMGGQLSWNRSDDTKGAFITITLNDVSIENEADWTQMANFHAEWSKRFFDVIVPYLK